MPGETLEEALCEAERLREADIPVIITLLGENVEAADRTRAVVDEYLRALREARARGLDLEVSIKPTHLGIDQDPELVRRYVGELAEASAPARTLWIDMEGSAYTDRTLELYRAVRARTDNVGVCLQAYLRRTGDDLADLLPLEPRIRLVKGAYAEPADVAFPAKTDVDARYLALARTMLDGLSAPGKGFAAFGTHDGALIDRIAKECRERGIGSDRFEFEMLYGIGRARQTALAAEGLPVRVLISYGTAWFAWYMRRLAERPANVWFVLRSLVR